MKPRQATGGTRSFDGGCACGALRYRLQREPMFVHCCHCTRCQRETGTPFAHHAMVESTEMKLLSGKPDFVKVPTDSGNTHWVIRCPISRTAVWNQHGSRSAAMRYVRVGTLDEPSRFPPLAHIYARSKQPWVGWSADTPSFAEYYDTGKTWPAASLARLKSARAAKVAESQRGRAASRSR